MKILVTGGTGFAGSHLLEALLEQGYKDIYATCFHVPEVGILSKERYISLDLTDSAKTGELIKNLQPDWIFHLASFAYVGKSFDKAEALFTNNIRLELSLLDAVRHYSPQSKILNIGSAEEYGIVPEGTVLIDETVPLNPVNPYAVSKVTQDLLAGSYVLSYNLKIIRARPFNHIGPRQSPDFAIPAFVKQIKAIKAGEQSTLFVGNLEGIRDFTSVKDMVRAYILLMEKGEIGQVYNIGSGIGVKMSEVVRLLCQMAGQEIKLETDSTRFRPLDVPALVADNRKIKALGWQPQVSLEQALASVYQA